MPDDSVPAVATELGPARSTQPTGPSAQRTRSRSVLTAARDSKTTTPSLTITARPSSMPLSLYPLVPDPHCLATPSFPTLPTHHSPCPSASPDHPFSLLPPVLACPVLACLLYLRTTHSTSPLLA